MHRREQPGQGGMTDLEKWASVPIEDMSESQRSRFLAILAKTNEKVAMYKENAPREGYGSVWHETRMLNEEHSNNRRQYNPTASTPLYKHGMLSFEPPHGVEDRRM